MFSITRQRKGLILIPSVIWIFTAPRDLHTSRAYRGSCGYATAKAFEAEIVGIVSTQPSRHLGYHLFQT